MDKKNQAGRKLKPGQLYWLILEAIGSSLIAAGGTPFRPILPIMIGRIMKILKEVKKLQVEEEKVKRSLQKLEKNQIIDLIEEGDRVYVYIKDYKNTRILKYSIKALFDFKKKKKKWNGKWFLVFFDVPEIQRNKRDYLRRFLKELGFYPYQKSVYLFPYECEEEINLIKKITEGGKYMKYIIADKIEDEEVIKNFFEL